jgi:multidrug efflux pump subunit AcrA (membrane-fusion protein)
MEAEETLTVVGTVTARRHSRVASERAGIVAAMPVRQGDYVESGAVLCKLTDDIALLRLAEASARLEALSARHQELLAGTRPEELARLRAVFEETTAEFHRWKFEKERVEKLFEGRDSNAKEYTDTVATFLAAERRQAAAQANYEMGRNGPRKETIAYAAHEVGEQKAAVDRLATELQKSTIRAPFAGFVVGRLVEIGEWVETGGPIVELVDLSTVLVRVAVPETAVTYARVAAAARVHVDAHRRTFPGVIRHVIRQADERARTFPVEVEVDNAEQLLAAGMFARVTVPAGAARSVVAVPKDAVVERNGIPHVAIVPPAPPGELQAHLVPVTVGADVGDWIAVTAGEVQAGTQIITHGNERMELFRKAIAIVDEAGNPVAPSEPSTPIDARPNPAASTRQGT